MLLYISTLSLPTTTTLTHPILFHLYLIFLFIFISFQRRCVKIVFILALCTTNFSFFTKATSYSFLFIYTVVAVVVAFLIHSVVVYILFIFFIPSSFWYSLAHSCFSYAYNKFFFSFLLLSGWQCFCFHILYILYFSVISLELMLLLGFFYYYYSRLFCLGLGFLFLLLWASNDKPKLFTTFCCWFISGFYFPYRLGIGLYLKFLFE